MNIYIFPIIVSATILHTWLTTQRYQPFVLTLETDDEVQIVVTDEPTPDIYLKSAYLLVEFIFGGIHFNITHANISQELIKWESLF